MAHEYRAQTFIVATAFGVADLSSVWALAVAVGIMGASMWSDRALVSEQPEHNQMTGRSTESSLSHQKRFIIILHFSVREILVT
jgi:hypothetical protein